MFNPSLLNSPNLPRILENQLHPPQPIKRAERIDDIPLWDAWMDFAEAGNGEGARTTVDWANMINHTYTKLPPTWQRRMPRRSQRRGLEKR